MSLEQCQAQTGCLIQVRMSPMSSRTKAGMLFTVPSGPPLRGGISDKGKNVGLLLTPGG